MSLNIESLEKRIGDLEDKEEKNIAIKLENKKKYHDAFYDYTYGAGMGTFAGISSFVLISFLGTTPNGLFSSLIICALYGILIIKGA